MGIVMPPDKRCWPCVFYISEYGLCDMPACDKAKGACEVYKQYQDIFLRQQKIYQEVYMKIITK